jgi:hypothetical protein
MTASERKSGSPAAAAEERPGPVGATGGGCTAYMDWDHQMNLMTIWLVLQPFYFREHNDCQGLWIAFINGVTVTCEHP